MAKIVLRGVAVFVVYVLSVVAIVYALNFWFWAYVMPKKYLAEILLTQHDALFLEGTVFLIFGLLLMLGRGGINLWTIKAAILGSAADALYGQEGRKAPGPSEIIQKDMWKPSGFVRFGLVLIFAGIILILLYLL